MAGVLRKGHGTLRPVHSFNHKKVEDFDTFYWQSVPHAEEKEDYSEVKATAEDLAKLGLPPKELLAPEKLRRYVKMGLGLYKIMNFTGLTQGEVRSLARSCGCYEKLCINTYN